MRIAQCTDSFLPIVDDVGRVSPTARANKSTVTKLLKKIHSTFIVHLLIICYCARCARRLALHLRREAAERRRLERRVKRTVQQLGLLLRI